MKKVTKEKKEQPKSKKQIQADALEQRYYDEDGKFKWEGQSSGSESSEVEFDAEVDSDEVSGLWSVDEEP